jgi:F-type H+-transporting ATPase subunit epsilon
MSLLECIVVTPERTVCEQPADFVAVTLYDGEIGIAPRHTPLIGRLDFGEMRIVEGDKIDRYYVEGGFVEVLDDVITVLTSRAIPAAEIDEAVALEQLHSAQSKPSNTPELRTVRDRAMMQSRAQLSVARRAKSSSADQSF